MSQAHRRVVEVVCALLQRDDTVLIAQRPAGKHLALKWEFPGGKVEPGEDHWKALQRELLEELGCTVECPVPLAFSDYEYEHLTARMIPFVCQLKADSAEPRPIEHEALQWVPWKELGRHDLAPADWPVLENAERWRSVQA